jgi:hypothetical protein
MQFSSSFSMPAMLQSRSEGAMILRPICSALLRDLMYGLIPQRYVPSYQAFSLKHLRRNIFYQPILFLSQRLLGTTIIDSHSPFRVPHIIINAPPPQDLWIPWNNATNDPQDHGYGRLLIVPSPSVGVINASVEDWEVYSSSDSSAAGSTVDPSESSQTGTPMPETPMDDVDLSFFIARPGDDIGGGMVDNFYYPGLSFEPNSNELPCAPDPPQPYRPIFSIEEDEDDLPPFDDWYKQ